METEALLAERKYQWDFRPELPCEDGYEDVLPALQVITKEDFNSMTEQEQDSFVFRQLSIIREVNIYPVHYYNIEGITGEIWKCITKPVYFGEDALEEFSPIGITLLDFMFPNLHHARSHTREDCAYDRFFDDEKLSKCIKRYMAHYNFLSVRTMYMMYSRFFWQTPMNFAPMRMKAIVEKFCPMGGVVYDYAAGFGGRLLGTLSSRNGYKYIGTDPCKDTYINLLHLSEHIARVTRKHGCTELFNCCSEELELPSESVDFAFSCPPFFNVEIYSDEPTQSGNRYKTYEEWLEGYFRLTIRNCYKALKHGGKFGMDIFNFYYKARKYFVVDDLRRIALEEGFKFEKSYPVLNRTRKLVDILDDVECIHIFVKE